MTQAAALIDGFDFDRVIADRGYASHDFVQTILQQGMQAVIPPHPTANVKPSYDTWLYRERHLVECFINKLKHFRRVFARYEKLDSRFLGFLHFISVLIWLR